MSDTKENDNQGIEAQIERAYAALRARDCRDVQGIMRDLLAGRFKNEPLPEIAAPPYPHDRLDIFFRRDRKKFYVFANGIDGWCDLTGPDRDTEREAILAWNAVFAKTGTGVAS